MSCGAENLANTLIGTLTSGLDFTLPNVDLSDADMNLPTGPGSLFDKVLTPADISTLTTKVVDGDGVFDVMMTALSAHLKKEYESNRITGAEYTKVYIANAQLAMQTAVAWQAQKDQAYWSSVTAQMGLLQGRVALKTAAVDLATARVRTHAMRAEYALTALKTANEDAQYCINSKQSEILSFNLAQLLPTQLLLTKEQAEAARSQTADLRTDGQPMGGVVHTQNEIARFNLSQMLPAQLLLTKEQMEAARAQTADNRTDNQAIGGSVGAQKDLYRQQIISYQRSAQLNAARVFSDAWISIKAVDEGVNIPASLTSDSVGNVLAALKAANGL